MLLARLPDLGLGPLQEPWDQHRRELVDPLRLGPLRHRRPLRLLEQVAGPHHLRQPGEHGGPGRDHEIAVGAAKDPGTERRRRPRPRRHVAGVLVAHQVRHPPVDRPHPRLERAHVQVVALAGSLSPHQRDRRRRRGDGPDVKRRHVPGQVQRLPLRMARVDHRPAHPVERDVRSLPVAVRPRLPEIADRRHHQRRVRRAQRRVVEPQRRQHARVEVLHDHVGPRRQPPYGVAPRGRLQVQGHRPFAGVQEQEQPAPLEAGLMLVERRDVSRGVARLWALHLHHVRSVVGQQPGRERPGCVPRQVQDADAGEWQWLCTRHAGPVFPLPPGGSAGPRPPEGRIMPLL